MSSNGPGSDEAFGKLVERFQPAVDARAFVEAADVVHDVFSLASEWCEQNPSVDLNLTIAAAECEENADWSTAESMYIQILSLPDTEFPTESRAHSRLAGLYRLLHRDSDALDHARRATAARRADLPSLLLMALEDEVRCLIKCRHIAAACNAVAEALSVIGNDGMLNQNRASMLTLRAECALHNQTLTDADADLETAFGLLQPLADMDIAAGIHCDLAKWWSVTARLRGARGDRHGAVSAWRQAVSTSQHVASLPHAESAYTKVMVADMLNGLADALWACDRLHDAASAFEERKDILRSVGLPEDHGA